MQNRLGDSTKTTPNTTDYNPEADVIMASWMVSTTLSLQLSTQFKVLLFDSQLYCKWL